MLVQIPDTSEAVDGKSIYKVFNIHINGGYHCSLRYSQLLAFYNELKQNFNTTNLEEFPPKRLLSLTDWQLEERRILLEKYLHSVFQDRLISQSDLFKEFLLAAQLASTELTDHPSPLEVYLINGKKVTITVNTSDRSDEILEKVALEIELRADLTYYFGLFLEELREGGSPCSLVRPLQDFEAPCVSMETANKQSPHRVTLRRNFWEPNLMSELLSDRVAKNMLYIEAVADIDRGYWEVGREKKGELSALQKKGQKKEYLESARKLPQCCYRQLDGLTFDHPSSDLEGSVRVGRMEVVTYTREGGGLKECLHYPITRMRCWKVGYKESTGKHWVSFHFQQSRDELVWVTMVGQASIFLAICLHSAVGELLRQRSNKAIRKPSENPIRRHPRELPHVTFHHPPVSPLESSEGQGGEEGSVEEEGSVREVVKRESLASSTSTDRGSVGQEQVGRAGSLEDSTGSRPAAVQQNGDTPTAHSQTSITKAPKSSKKKTSIGRGDTENPTFQSGTDDDL